MLGFAIFHSYISCHETVVFLILFLTLSTTRINIITHRIRERKESVTVLLCGTSGCGKSTLSALLVNVHFLRLYALDGHFLYI